MLRYSEPLASVICKLFHGAVPKLSPCVKGEKEMAGLLLERHCDVRIEDDLLEGYNE